MDTVSLVKPNSLMKKIIAAIIASLVVASCYDVNKAPESVQSAFETMFPGAAQVEWEKELKVYRAEFVYDGRELEACFTSEGKWIQTSTGILLTELPEAVLAAARKCSDWEIDDVAFCERAEGIQAYYLIEYEKKYSSRRKSLRILPDGKILNGF